MSTQRNYARAAILALIAFTSWTLSDALLKLVRTEGIPQGEIFIMSGISGMAALFFISAARGNLRRLQPHRWGAILTLGFCQLGAFFCWMIALPKLPLANMYVVSFLTPMTVACMAALILKEPLGWKRATAISVGFFGVVIAVNPQSLFQGDGTWLPYLALFGNMMGSALQMFLLRVVADKEKSECTSFYPRVVLLLAGLVLCGMTGFVALKPWVVLSLCAQGILGAFGWTLMAKAYKSAPAAAVAPFQYSQMLGGALLGFLLWNDVPSAYLICGSGVIICSGLYLVRHERRVTRLMSRVE